MDKKTFVLTTELGPWVLVPEGHCAPWTVPLALLTLMGERMHLTVR